MNNNQENQAFNVEMNNVNNNNRYNTIQVIFIVVLTLLLINILNFLNFGLALKYKEYINYDTMLINPYNWLIFDSIYGILFTILFSSFSINTVNNIVEYGFNKKYKFVSNIEKFGRFLDILWILLGIVLFFKFWNTIPSRVINTLFYFNFILRSYEYWFLYGGRICL